MSLLGSRQQDTCARASERCLYREFSQLRSSCLTSHLRTRRRQRRRLSGRAMIFFPSFTLHLLRHSPPRCRRRQVESVREAKKKSCQRSAFSCQPEGRFQTEGRPIATGEWVFLAFERAWSALGKPKSGLDLPKSVTDLIKSVVDLPKSGSHLTKSKPPKAWFWHKNPFFQPEHAFLCATVETAPPPRPNDDEQLPGVGTRLARPPQRSRVTP